ncbi:hypothetical protein TNCT_717361 [Trichonephila clavata]|uniref:Uncharacterized protein n=1 Tax=Trichonephila clavata TaxID=2740835 RepID=A0A8X6FJU3_TRICU|nr:hypothetical protein TNCT_717361 [Trichonephila clavata]
MDGTRRAEKKKRKYTTQEDAKDGKILLFSPMSDRYPVPTIGRSIEEGRRRSESPGEGEGGGEKNTPKRSFFPNFRARVARLPSAINPLNAAHPRHGEDQRQAANGHSAVKRAGGARE